MADCTYHPGKDGVGACINCGKMVCIACRTELQEKVYCPPCANKLFVAKADVPTYVPTGPVVQTVSSAWWLLVILPFIFGASWIGGIIAWVANKGKDPKKASSMLTWGIVLTVIWLIIVAAVVVLLLTGVLEMATE
jgi:hypothetical protein